MQTERTRSMLLFANVSARHYGNYTCRAANRLGASSASMRLLRASERRSAEGRGLGGRAGSGRVGGGRGWLGGAWAVGTPETAPRLTRNLGKKRSLRLKQFELRNRPLQ